MKKKEKDKNQPTSPKTDAQFLMYEGKDGTTQVDVRLEGETLWLSIKQMADLFGVDKSGISRHLKNVFESGELTRDSTVAKFATVQIEGSRTVSRDVEYYNLDAIISVGYRVNSVRGTQFRMWATERLREYLIKGFTMDDNRLKEASDSRYFEELLARIRDIRSSEKVFWRKILDIYATSIDYDSKAESSRAFFKQVQNKLHWAAHGHTAAELVFERVDAEKDNMGITNFPGKRVLKRDVEVAKNYLSEDELAMLNRLVTAYLELAEIQAIKQIPMYMNDWTERLDQFLSMTGGEILKDAGKISHKNALKKAHDEYEKFKEKRRNAPSKVEIDFVETEKRLKMISSDKNKKGKKK